MNFTLHVSCLCHGDVRKLSFGRFVQTLINFKLRQKNMEKRSGWGKLAYRRQNNSALFAVFYNISVCMTPMGARTFFPAPKRTECYPQYYMYTLAGSRWRLSDTDMAKTGSVISTCCMRNVLLIYVVFSENGHCKFVLYVRYFF